VLRFWCGSTREVEKSVKLSLGDFFWRAKLVAARIPHQSPVTWHYHHAGRAAHFCFGCLFCSAISVVDFPSESLILEARWPLKTALQRVKTIFRTPGSALFLLEHWINVAQGRMTDFDVECANLYRSYLRYTLR
jgi:hypothetical protein